MAQALARSGYQTHAQIGVAGWGLQRTGSRIREAVGTALPIVLHQHDVMSDRGFLMSRSQSAVAIRDRAEVASQTLRKPEMLPPQEVKKALQAIISVNLGIETDDAITECARLFGFRSTSPQLRSLLSEMIEELTVENGLLRRGKKLYSAELSSV